MIIVDYDDELNTINRIEAKIDPDSVISGNTIRDRHLRSISFLISLIIQIFCLL